MYIIVNRHGAQQPQFGQFVSEGNAYNVLRKAIQKGQAAGCRIHFIPKKDNSRN